MEDSVERVEQRVAHQEEKKKASFELVERLRSSKSPEDAKGVGDELGRLLFGE